MPLSQAVIAGFRENLQSGDLSTRPPLTAKEKRIQEVLRRDRTIRPIPRGESVVRHRYDGLPYLGIIVVSPVAILLELNEGLANYIDISARSLSEIDFPGSGS